MQSIVSVFVYNMNIKEAGRHIIKGNFGMAFNAISNRTIVTSDYRGGNGFWLFNQLGGNVDVQFSYSGTQSVKIAYETCSPLSA